ncbi:MAG: AraC family transcriptional regulator ligand-binding domain-containing protein [Pseudomonadota bacterium]
MIALLVKTLAARGIDVQALLARAGIAPAALDHPDTRLPSAQVDRLWDLAMEASNHDWSIILDTTRRHGVGTLHVLGFGLQACASLKEATERLAGASAVFNTGLHASSVCSGNEFEIRFEYKYAGAATAKDIITAAILLHTWRQLLRSELVPSSVHFSRVLKPADIQMQAYLEHFFGCPVLYGKKENRIALPLAVALESLPNANAMLAARGETVVADYLAQLQRSCFATSVAHCIAEGEFLKDGVARRLNISTRTLQRRLKEEGLGFAQLLADTRRDLACTHLRSGRYTVKEVAYMLGYSDPANFSRAFRSWYGQVPDAFRRGIT